MLAARITSHQSDAQARLVSQYQGATLLKALLAGIGAGIQGIEDATFALDAGRQLASAKGVQLDLIGSLFSVLRNGLDDASYLSLLQGVIAQNTSDGTHPLLAQMVATLFQTAQVFVKDGNSQGQQGVPGRAWVAFAVGSSPVTGAMRLTIIQQAILAALPAAVGLAYIASFKGPKGFCMAGPQAWVGGFGDKNNPAVGAAMASLIYTDGRV